MQVEIWLRLRCWRLRCVIGTGMSAVRTRLASRLRLLDDGGMGVARAISRMRRCLSQGWGVPFSQARAVTQARERGERLQGRQVVDVQVSQLRDQRGDGAVRPPGPVRLCDDGCR